MVSFTWKKKGNSFLRKKTHKKWSLVSGFIHMEIGREQFPKRKKEEAQSMVFG